MPSEIVGETLGDPDVSPELFSVIALLTVAICEDPWLEGSDSVENRINRADHGVILTRVVLF